MEPLIKKLEELYLSLNGRDGHFCMRKNYFCILEQSPEVIKKAAVTLLNHGLEAIQIALEDYYGSSECVIKYQQDMTEFKMLFSYLADQLITQFNRSLWS